MPRFDAGLCIDVRPLLYDRAHESRTARTAVSSVGRRAKGRRPQAPIRASERSASYAPGFPKGALHVTLRMRREVWNLRTHRCFRALRWAFARGCERFGFRLVHFSVQGNHIHCIVEAPDAERLGRAMKGLEVRMARALNNVMQRTGPAFADRYHAHLLTSPREAANAIRYVLENWSIHAGRNGDPAPPGVDPYCSAASHDCGLPLVVELRWWMLRVGVQRSGRRAFAA